MKILADLTKCHQNKTHYYLNEATKQTVSAALLALFDNREGNVKSKSPIRRFCESIFTQNAMRTYWYEIKATLQHKFIKNR